MWPRNSSKTIPSYKQLIFTDCTCFPTISINSFWYSLYIVKLCRNRMVFFRLWVTVLGKWCVFRCLRASIRPFRLSWSPFLILHKLSSFRICSLEVHVFVALSMSSMRTFFPGKLSISLWSCSEVRLACPIWRCTLLSQRPISASRSPETFTWHIFLNHIFFQTTLSTHFFQTFKLLVKHFLSLSLHDERDWWVDGLSDTSDFWELKSVLFCVENTDVCSRYLSEFRKRFSM